MKKTRMSVISAAALAGALLFGAQAHADLITGQLSLAGGDSFTSSSITFNGMGDIVGDNGAFTEMGTCATCVALTSFTSSSSGFQLYNATNNGNTTTLTLDNITLFQFVTGPDFDTLTIKGTGTATLTGFDPTSGAITLTTQGPTGSTATDQLSFSSTTIPVPEPSSLMLLGTGLAALGLFGFLRRRNA